MWDGSGSVVESDAASRSRSSRTVTVATSSVSGAVGSVSGSSVSVSGASVSLPMPTRNSPSSCVYSSVPAAVDRTVDSVSFSGVVATSKPRPARSSTSAPVDGTVSRLARYPDSPEAVRPNTTVSFSATDSAGERVPFAIASTIEAAVASVGWSVAVVFV